MAIPTPKEAIAAAREEFSRGGRYTPLYEALVAAGHSPWPRNDYHYRRSERVRLARRDDPWESLHAKLAAHQKDRARVARLRKALAAEAAIPRAVIHANRGVDLRDPLSLLAVKASGGQLLANRLRREARRAKLLVQARQRDTYAAWTSFFLEFPLSERAAAAEAKRVVALRETRSAALAVSIDQQKRRRGKLHARLRERVLPVVRLLRAAGWPISARRSFALVKNVPEEVRQAAYRRESGSLRGHQAYPALARVLPGASVATEDLGRYSSRCTYHKFDRSIEIASWEVHHGDHAILVQDLVARCTEGRAWVVKLKYGKAYGSGEPYLSCDWRLYDENR